MAKYTNAFFKEMERRKSYLCAQHFNRKLNRLQCYTMGCPLAKLECWNYYCVADVWKRKGNKKIIQYLERLEVPEDWEAEK